jgi:hypothetical protein
MANDELLGFIIHRSSLIARFRPIQFLSSRVDHQAVR